MSKRISKIAASVPSTDAEVEALISITLKTQTERETIIAERDQALQKQREALEAEKHYDRDLKTKDVILARNLELLETWAVMNKKKRFGKVKSILIGTARLGWRLGNWKTRLMSKVKWVDVVDALQAFLERGDEKDASEKAKARAALAQEYIRISVEADKEAMLRDRADRKSRALLKKAGVYFDQDETFYVDPNREGQQPATLVAS
jgi:Bacteriophage Mu Gam like protein